MRDSEEATSPALPRYRFRNAVIIGALASVFCIAQSLAITLANASTYHAFDIAKDQAVKNALAFTIFWFAVLTFFITLLILLIAGFIAGKIVIQRRLGFLAGFVTGFIVYGAGSITNYIPNYPGVQHTASTTSGSGGLLIVLLIALIFFLVWGIIGGLVSLLGAWIATRKHPYYTGY